MTVLVMCDVYCVTPCSWKEDYNRKDLKHGPFEPHEAAEVQVRTRGRGISMFGGRGWVDGEGRRGRA